MSEFTPASGVVKLVASADANCGISEQNDFVPPNASTGIVSVVFAKTTFRFTSLANGSNAF